jgi:hypothetical protein
VVTPVFVTEEPRCATSDLVDRDELIALIDCEIARQPDSTPADVAAAIAVEVGPKRLDELCDAAAAALEAAELTTPGRLAS